MPAQTGPNQLPGPVYAVAGVGDLLAEQVRKLVDNAPEIQAQFQRNATSLPEELRQLPRDLRALAADLPSYAANLQGKARDLDGETVRRNLGTAQTKAQEVYRTLVQRGELAMNPPPAE